MTITKDVTALDRPKTPIVHSSEIADDPGGFHGDYVLVADVDALEAFYRAQLAAALAAHRERPTPEPQSFPHRCSGCGLRWHTIQPGSAAAELCGDCWRKAQPILHAVPPVPVEGLNLGAAKGLLRVLAYDGEYARYETVKALIAEVESLRARLAAVEGANK